MAGVRYSAGVRKRSGVNMEFVVGIVALGLVAWIFLRSRRQASGDSASVLGAVIATSQHLAKHKPVPVEFDLSDPSIGNPRERMTSLGWNQVVVLNHAISGFRIHYAAPGASHSEDGCGGYFYQRRTVDSLLKAGFLAPSEPNGFVITPLGCKALHTLPERSN